MEPVVCFTIAPTGTASAALRRYSHGDDCPDSGYHHEASTPLPDVACDLEDGTFKIDAPTVADDDPGWPSHCGCGYAFTDEDVRQVFTSALYGNEAGEVFAVREAPPGAVWEAPWCGSWAGINGTDVVLVVKLPNGHDWMPGSEASNCGRKGEDHDCWCVHGTSPVLTVDKVPEPGRSTCTAGAGSIASGEGGKNPWHGFLRDGRLVLA